MDELVQAARAVGIAVREFRRGAADPPPQSGLVILRGQPVLFLERDASEEEKIAVIGRALMNYDLEDIYLSPAARTAVEQS